MTAILTIARRELTAQFFSPIAYVSLTIFALLSTLIFFFDFVPGEEATIRTELTWLVWLLVFILPAVSMRLISEELRTGTIETLMTSPINDTQVILGKWLGAMVFFVALLIPVLVHVAVLEWNGRPDYGPILTGLMGLMLVGGLYMAIGLFVSAFTSSQIVAWFITVTITGFMTIGMYMLSGQAWMPKWLALTLHYVNVDEQFHDFAKGLIDITNFIYFVSGIGLFLFMAVIVLQSRRWR